MGFGGRGALEIFLCPPLLGPTFQISSGKGTGDVCKLSPLHVTLDVVVEEIGKEPPLESQGWGGVHVDVYEREGECMRERERTHLHAKPSNCKNYATCFLLTSEGVLLFHVNLAHAGSHLQFVLFGLFRNQEVFFCVFLFFFWKS